VVPSYFRKQRIERIRFLTKPYRTRARGCVYFFFKFQMVLVTLGLAFHALYITDRYKTEIAQAIRMDQDVMLASVLAVLIVFVVQGSFVAIDSLERVWRRRLKKNDEAETINLRGVLEQHRDCEALLPITRQQIADILQKPGNIEDNLEKFSYYELILTEDALLYDSETKGIMCGFSYGLRIIYAMVFFFFVIVFATVYSYAEIFVNHQFSVHKRGFILLIVFLFVGMYAAYRAPNDSHYYWNRIGVLGRCYTRLAVYYWPITLGLWLAGNAIYKAYLGLQ